MSGEFEIVREFEVAAKPQEVWDAITTGTGGWLWPSEYKPGEDESITTWDPPHRLTVREEITDPSFGQTLNQLDHVIDAREGGSFVRYVHSGIFVADWDNQYDGAQKHTTFYLHTLRQYLEHFAGRQAAFTTVDGPAAAGAPDALETAARALSLPDDAPVGGTVLVTLPGVGETDAVLDYRDPHFIGLRTDSALYRLFGRNHFGHVVGVSVHDFAPNAGSAERAWREWLDATWA
ncbi:SRPBCC family protein [Streptomyces radicis]|uniref:SRPBCC domain-containing protein n=1 Tax=Streptomyces radicis TaxID=1750517 RepID=A0A3A9W7Q2_9ACTN|nr:SRPBCC domain-containing protein [Streptomyces radicis]RKN08403.1 SRPBCC domain-containing protein [Streptomyces radicis]RKN21562.1 SRPBCC domain-containing protein [Streptomyces radicis]